MHVQTQRASWFVAVGVNVIDSFFDGIQDRLSIREQVLPCFRQCHATRRAIEKPDAKPLLQGTHHPANACSGNAKLRRGFCETPLFRDRDKSAEVSKLSATHCDIPATITASALLSTYQTEGL
jgi:hypothetical protein